MSCKIESGGKIVDFWRWNYGGCAVIGNDEV